MTKQQEIDNLKKFIERSEIHQTIDLLEAKLKLYRNAYKVHEDLYNINREFDSISQILSRLKIRIEDVLSEI